MPSERCSIQSGVCRAALVRRIVAANDVRHPDVVTSSTMTAIRRNGSPCERRKHKIVEYLVGEDLILPCTLSSMIKVFVLLGRSRRRITGSTPGALLGAIAPAAVVAHRLPRDGPSRASPSSSSDAGVTTVGAAGREQLLGDLAMARGALKLADASPSQFRPSHSNPSRSRDAAFVERSRSVSSMRSRNFPPALSVEPVEQRRARAADVQEAGRRRRGAGDDLRHCAGARSARFETSAWL